MSSGAALAREMLEPLEPRAVGHGRERIGMTRQTVIAIEQNKCTPSLEAAFRIADVFGVSIFRWTRG